MASDACATTPPTTAAATNDEERVLAAFARYIEDYNAHDLTKILSHIDDKIQVFMAPELHVPAYKGKNVLRSTYGADTRNEKVVAIGRAATAECSDDGATASVSVGLHTRNTAMDMEIVYRVADMQQIRHVVSNVRDLGE